MAVKTQNTTSAEGTPLEPVTGAVPVTDSNHMQVHLKRAFTVGYSAQVAPGGVLAMALEVPAAAYVHFQAVRLLFSGAIKFEMFEGPTYSGGSASVPRNKHRISPPASVVTVKKGVTGISGGTDLFDGPIYLGTAGAAQRASIGGATGDDSEWVLNPSTTYLFRLTSLEGSQTINVALIPFWYEEPGA